MKKILSLLLCILVLSGILAMPVSALSYYVSYYEEAIYAGGVVDLYASPSAGDPEDYTYQWQYDAGIGDGHWYNIEENGNYSGTKTNHLRMYTSTGNYNSWEEIPFQCVVTATDGTVRRTDNIYMYIYPTDKLIPNMKNWGYGLYTPSITNVTDLYTKDDVHYTASVYAGTNLKIFCGSKPVDDQPILRKSEVELKTEIHITENGKTTVSGNSTAYIPYTVGKTQVQIKEKLTIGGFDLGYFDTKTIDITVAKPRVISTGTAKSNCSLLRYTYNESQKLASVPKGTSLEIVGEEGSYYQVYYNGFVGYIGTALVDVAVNESKIIEHVDLRIAEPLAGNVWGSSVSVKPDSCFATSVEWYDKTAGHYLSSGERFIKGHDYQVVIWVSAKEGYWFKLDSNNNMLTTAMLNETLPCFTARAYEQVIGKVIDIRYDFNNVQEETTTPPQSQHTHSPSGWRTTGAYHYKVCTTCGDFLEQEDHYGGVATCTEKGKCTVCGYAYIEENENHDPDTSKWTACADLYHAHLCKNCGAHCDAQDHVAGPVGTPDAAVVCKDCGYIITPAKDHKHNLTKVARKDPTCTEPGNLEYYTCDGCSDLFADSEGKAQITDMVIAPLGHTISEDWQFDVNNHWRTCSVCEGILTETQMGHEMAGETCTICGYENTTPATDPGKEPVTEPTDTPPAPTDQQSSDPGSGGAPWWIPLLIGLVAVAAGVGGGALILNKKKKE